MIQVTIDGKGYEYPENCSYYEIAKDFEKTMDAPIVLVKVDGRLRELHKQLKKDCELEFVTTEDEIGHKNVSEESFSSAGKSGVSCGRLR